MTRQKGSRNKGYDEEKQRLAQLLFDALVSSSDEGPSFRQLASACDVSPSTLRHYFTDRKGAIEAAIEHAGSNGKPHLNLVRHGEFGEAKEALLTLLRYLSFGWQHSELGDLHRVGLEAGLSDAKAGKTYLESILEPAVQAFSDRIQLHIDRGELKPCTPRFAALSLLSPVLLAMLHQKQLNGEEKWPLSIDEFIQEHVDFFLQAHLKDQVA